MIIWYLYVYKGYDKNNNNQATKTHRNLEDPSPIIEVPFKC